MKVAWIGTGAIGTPMAEILLNKNYSLSVYNRTPDNAKKLVKMSAKFHDKPSMAVKDADVVFVTVRDDTASAEVYEGQYGLIEGLKNTAVVIECSTLSLDQCEHLQKLISSKTSAKFLVAPLVGTPKTVKMGQLMFLVGGDRELFQQVNPLLSDIGKDIVYVGSIKQAMAFKLALTTSVGLQILLQAELTNYLLKYDLNEEILGIFSNLPFTKAICDITNEMAQDGDFQTQFPINLVHKDMNYLTMSQKDKAKENTLVYTAKDVYRNVHINANGFVFS